MRSRDARHPAQAVWHQETARHISSNLQSAECLGCWPFNYPCRRDGSRLGAGQSRRLLVPYNTRCRVRSMSLSSQNLFACHQLLHNSIQWWYSLWEMLRLSLNATATAERRYPQSSLYCLHVRDRRWIIRRLATRSSHRLTCSASPAWPSCQFASPTT
jgi:hypothetical protein